MAQKRNLKKLGQKVLGERVGKNRLVTNPDGTINKRKTYQVKPKSNDDGDPDNRMGGAWAAGMANRATDEAIYKADEKRAKHRQKVQGTLLDRSNRVSSPSVSTRSNARNLVKEAADEKAQADQERAELRKKQRYY